MDWLKDLHKNYEIRMNYDFDYGPFHIRLDDLYFSRNPDKIGSLHWRKCYADRSKEYRRERYNSQRAGALAESEEFKKRLLGK